MASPGTPGNPGRRLRSVLRRARIDSNLTQQQIADRLGWSLSKTIRLETGASRISVADILALAATYDIQAPLREEMVEWARAARYDRFIGMRDLLSPAFISYLEAEASAAILSQYHPSLIPGLLQTEAYSIAAVTALSRPSREDLQRLVSFRMERQELIEDESRSFNFLLDESALLRDVAGETERLKQWNTIASLSRQENVWIGVVPLSLGVHAGLRGPFIVLEFSSEWDDDVLFLELPTGDFTAREHVTDLTKYQELFAELRARSVDVIEYLGSAVSGEG